MSDDIHPSPSGAALHRRLALVRHMRAQPRLLGCVVLALVAYVLCPSDWRLATRLLIAWNVGVWSYLAACAHMLAGASHESIRRRALLQDEGRHVVLVLAVLAALASIAAIVAQLATTKEAVGIYKAMRIGLAGGTIVGAFAFIHLTFALHYAHEYVMERRAAQKEAGSGLQFPGTEKPDYLDFLYFSFVIGVAGQTADVSISSQAMRRVALLHCVLSFFFNTTVLALTINIAASLF